MTMLSGKKCVQDGILGGEGGGGGVYLGFKLWLAVAKRKRLSDKP